MQFQGTKDYVATDDLKIAVNAAVTLERPLLVKGEPGTGKTELARQVADALGLRMIEWNVKSTTRGIWDVVLAEDCAARAADLCDFRTPPLKPRE
ncbi:MAG: AAA family ATPase, partial [Pseudomonadota bacterium]|nr:AAA family ATPase [Pseudomonadota bacterium]